jgi:S-layer homology domain
MRRFFLVIGLLLAISISSYAVVDLGEIGVGARPLGMGKACISGMDDATSIFTNPAGLALNKNFNVTSMSGTLLSDINYLMVGVSDYSPMGKFGVGYLNASIGGIPITTLTGSGSTAAVVQTDITNYYSSILFLSYGTKLSRIFRGKFEEFSFGATLKYFFQGFSGGGTTMQQAVGAGMDADLGFIWRAKPWARVGLAFNNFLPMSLGGKFVWQKNSETESIPMASRIGGEINLLGKSAIYHNDRHKLKLLVDYEMGRGDNRPAVFHTGLEYSPIKILALRMGIDQRPRATATEIGIDNNLTFGVGVQYWGYTFDYAYQQIGELTDNTAHFFSIGYRGPDEEKIDRSYYLRKSHPSLPLAEVVPKPELVAFSDIPNKFWAKKPIEYLATLGIMNGYPDQTFKPNKPLTRGELAALLVKTKGFKVGQVSKVSFKDLNTKHWSTPYIEMAIKRKYMGGYPDGTFRPNQAITRGEAAVLFSKFAGLYVKKKVKTKVFPDVKKKHWASPAIAATKQAGFFEYLSGKNFSPKKELTRAEAAEILSKTPLVKQEIKSLISGEK